MRTLRELRDERKWTQFDLAVKVGVTPGTIWNWENGKSEPRATQLRRLAEVLGVRMDEIVFPVEDEGKVIAA